MVRTQEPARGSKPLCGCWYAWERPGWSIQRSYLQLHSMQAHATIKDVTFRTVLTQTFLNNTNEHLKNMVYSFPLYDGVSVVSFTATIGTIQIHGVIKEKQQARRAYREAVAKGSSAGLLEQLTEASDVFTTTIGNVSAQGKVIIKIVYIGELRHDAELNGTRFTIPSSIAPRYGATPNNVLASSLLATEEAIRMTIDILSPEGCPIQQIQSPSHPITVSVGRTTDMSAATYMANRGSATLSLDKTNLDKDFIVIVSIKDTNVPKAFLETHTTIPHQRALMATLVPQFNLPPTCGEIVFIVDRSGSMQGKMDMVIKAMTVLLKSLPVGVKFNICSFGSHYLFLWPRSQPYIDMTLNVALNQIDTLEANFGGTEMFGAVESTISQRFNDMFLDVIILTDGQIWNQDHLFSLIRQCSAKYQSRFFSIGIGEGASTALVEGIATAGNGFSQFVAESEKMDTKMVRLLKGALSPRLNDYNLRVKYKREDDDYEIVESVEDASNVDTASSTMSRYEFVMESTISFFDDKVDTDSEALIQSASDKFAHLPVVSPPSIIQAPCQLPPLYPFSRTTVYLLLDPSTHHMTPEAVILRATSDQGPLELEIKVEGIGAGETIHQLASKRAVSELEKDGGWLATATDKTDGILLKKKYKGRWQELVEREAVRLGVKYQIAGKWCSFVALEGDVEHKPLVFRKLMPPMKQLMLPSKPAMRFKRPPAPHYKRVEVDEDDGKDRADGDELIPLSRRNRTCKSAVLLRGPATRFTARFRLLRGATFGEPAHSGHLTPEDKMHAIIRLQKSNGSWEWTQQLKDTLEFIDSDHRHPRLQSAVVATALAVAFLSKRMANEAHTWELIVEKAKAWLVQQHGVDVENEISQAEKLLD